MKVSTLWSVRCQLCHVKRGIELSGCFVPCVRRDVMIDDCTGSYPGSSTYLNSREVDTLMPVFAPSPKMAPSFFLPLFTKEPRSLDLICASSNLRLAVMVPAPSEHPSPRILSPT